MGKSKLFVFSGPSGCGKTTIARAILEQHPDFLFSVSATTRPKRNGEIHGKDYFFLSREEFENKIANSDLVEWEEIYGNFYGTLKSEILHALDNNQTMLFDVDVKGALSLRLHFPDNTVLIFIAPPDIDVLKERLLNRKTENEDTLRKRLERAEMELAQQNKFDYVIINDNLQRAIDDVKLIVSQHIKNN